MTQEESMKCNTCRIAVQHEFLARGIEEEVPEGVYEAVDAKVKARPCSDEHPDCYRIQEVHEASLVISMVGVERFKHRNFSVEKYLEILSQAPKPPAES